MNTNDILKIINKNHKTGFELPLSDNSNWVLCEISVDNLQLPDFIDIEDPYNRVIMIDYDYIDNYVDLSSYDPIIVDKNNFVLDGNHRAIKAKLIGLKTINAFLEGK